MLGLSKQSRLDRKLFKAASKGDLKGIEEALKAGANIEKKASAFLNYSMAPLNIAALNGYPEALRLLLDKGADINTRDSYGETPLMNAILKKNIKSATLLLERGADPKAGASAGRSALSMAIANDFTQIANRIQGLPDAAPQAAAAPAIPAPLPAEHPDEIVIRRPFGDKVLEETFNFAAKERISVLRASTTGPAEAMTREGFDAISDRHALRQAFEAYVRKGGRVPESDVFPDPLAKKALRLQGGQP